MQVTIDYIISIIEVCFVCDTGINEVIEDLDVLLRSQQENIFKQNSCIKVV